MNTSTAGDLNLGHIFAATGIDVSDTMVLRHTYKTDGLRSASDLTTEKIIGYTRSQGVGNMVGKNPPRIWVVFLGESRIRTRLLAVYENHGEVMTERTADRRCFDLRPSPALSSLVGRLVIQWSGFRSWARTGVSASEFPIVEIADPQDVEFPGFDHVILPYDVLQDVVEQPRYSAWRTALGAVQGVYLITDKSTGKLYVGKADGSENILGRWSAYARDGHGGNVALQDLAGLGSSHARHFQFSLLRVFGPSVPTAEVDAAEKHFKDALLARKYGLNRN